MRYPTGHAAPSMSPHLIGKMKARGTHPTMPPEMPDHVMRALMDTERQLSYREVYAAIREALRD